MTTVVLEGDGMEELLARVAAEHGGSARVVRAERVRVGGVAGFFARQRYEVVVEVGDDLDGGDDAHAAPSRVADGAPAGVKTTRTAAEDQGERPDRLPAGDGPQDGAARTTQDATGASAGPHPHQHGPRGRDDEETHVLGHPTALAAATAEVPAPRTTADPATRPAASAGRRDEVLGDIFDSPIARALMRANVLDADANAHAVKRATRVDPLDRLVDAADAGDDAAVRINGTNGTGVDSADAGTNGWAGGRTRGRHAAPAEPLERGRPVSTESAAFAAVLDAVRGAAEPDAADEPAPAPSPESARPAAEVPGGGAEPVAAGAAVAELMALLAARHVADAPEQAAAPDVAQAPGVAQAPAAQAPAAQAPVAQAPVAQAPAAQAPVTQPSTPRAPSAPSVQPAPSAPSAADGAADAASPRARAAAAGLPAHLLDRLPVEATAGDLHELLEELPGAPVLPSSEGDLVAVVGSPREALVVAKALATRLGLGPEGVLVAACPTGPSSPRREVVRDAVAARRAAATVRLGDAPGVVVVQVECDPESVRWARGVVSALQADQVHAVVDATRKSADTERWLDGVFAEDPDAAHVVQAAGSADPGTVLGLELPVASVDGGDGGASAWTSLLTRALEPLPADAAPVRRTRRTAR